MNTYTKQNAAGITGPMGPSGPSGMQGPAGEVLVVQGAVGGASTITFAKPSNTVIFHDVTLKGADGKEMQVGEIMDFMKIMKERMLILTPNFEKHEKYPVLKELYEQYIVMERLINDEHKPD